MRNSKSFFSHFSWSLHHLRYLVSLTIRSLQNTTTIYQDWDKIPSKVICVFIMSKQPIHHVLIEIEFRSKKLLHCMIPISK